MKNYVGTKLIKAKEMTRGEYNAYRDWDTPADEDPADAGYLVEYLDGGASNHPAHAHYISWSPKEVFEGAYLEFEGDGNHPPYLQRLSAEIAQNRDRMAKLKLALDNTYTQHVMSQLHEQYEIMQSLDDVLTRRRDTAIAALGPIDTQPWTVTQAP